MAEFYYEQMGCPVPAGEALCPYGRFGILGRAVRDGWQAIVKSHLGVFSFGLGGVVVGVVVSRVAKISAFAAIGLGLLGFVALVGAAVVICSAWALTPWGRRCHWETVRFPETFGWDAFAAVGHHWHSLDNMRAEVVDPLGNRTTYQMPFDPTVTGQKVLMAPGDRSVSAPIVHDQGPGLYKYRFRAELSGSGKTVTLAKARIRVKHS